jgi:ribosome-associated toxin RatA of RatAB toxin-antitoxin module
MRLERTALIGVNPDVAFRLISDPTRYPEFFSGLTRWEPRSRKRRGPGARFRVLMRVGSIEAGGIVRIAAWREDEMIAWRAESGLDHRGRWTLRSVPGGTELRLELEFRLQGPASRLVERLVGRILSRNMAATFLAVQRLLEHEAPPGGGRRSQAS